MRKDTLGLEGPNRPDTCQFLLFYEKKGHERIPKS